MTDDCTKIIDLLIEQRHKQGMTQQGLAKMTNLTQSVIARLENKKATPQLDTLIKVATALNCEIVIIPSK